MPVIGHDPVKGWDLHSASGLDSSVNSGWLNWNDIFVPGSSALDKWLDFSGKNAAEVANTAQWQMQKDAQAYNSAEAEKARLFEAQQSATAYQRAVADMKAAGLNPYWITSMNSASTASGSSASSSAGSSTMANNKIAMAAGLIATALRIFLMKH